MGKAGTKYGINFPLEAFTHEATRQYYTEKFKQEAVKLILIRESCLKLLESVNRLNITSQTLNNWLYRDRVPASTATTRKPIIYIEAEVSRILKELSESRLESEVLTKVTGCFAMESLQGTRR